MKLTAFIRIAAPAALVAAGMAVPVSAQSDTPTASDYADFEENKIKSAVERILANVSLDPCTRLVEVEQAIEQGLLRMDPAFIEPTRARIKERFDEPLETLRKICGRAAPRTVVHGGLGEIGVASDSTTFCTFRPGLSETFVLFPVLPALPGSPDCPEGREDCDPTLDPFATSLPDSTPAPEQTPPAEKPNPVFFISPEDNPCEELEKLTARFLELSGSLFITGNQRDDLEEIRSDQAISILPRILLLRRECPGPCEKLRELRAIAEAYDRQLALFEEAARAGVPLDPKRVANARATDVALQHDIEELEKICPDLDPFLEQIEKLAPPPPEPACPEGDCPELTTCQPGEPCGDLFTEDPSPPGDDPQPVNVPFNVPVKATSTALDEGERANQIAGQVVVLLTPDQLNPVLPQPGGERPQLGHDADRPSGVTDEEGRIEITVDLTDFVPGITSPPPMDGGLGGAFEIPVDTTARDGFIVMLPAGDPALRQIERLGLPLVSEFVINAPIEANGGDGSGATQFGAFNGPTDQIYLVRQIITTTIPEAVIESDLCMIKEPAGVTDYNGCDFEGERPSSGMRVLVPPPPHADLPGGSIDLEIAKHRSAP